MYQVLPRPVFLNSLLRRFLLGVAIVLAFAGEASAGPGSAGSGSAETARAAPPTAAATFTDGSKAQPDIFGTVAVPVSAVRMSGRWQEILAEHAEKLFQEPCRDDAALCATPIIRRWQEILSRRDELLRDPLSALQAVNSLVNGSVRYVRDIDALGVEDQWASPLDTVRRGIGDCEDYALLKMAMLTGLGFEPGSMQLVVGFLEVRKLGHSVLKVTVRGQALILDNLSDGVHRDREIPDYRPLYSLGPDGAWLHGYRRGRSLTVASR
jgi:predicted transglutaminase-like cysteine proteinase